MAWGLPKLPGLTFKDPTKASFSLNGSLKYYQGHRFPLSYVRGPGDAPTDLDSNAFSEQEDVLTYDPSLTYGRVKQPALPQVIPHYVHYDKKCLNFKAFMKQPVFDSPIEKHRLRIVNIIYYLDDDTMSVMEPQIGNSGIWQGRMVRRDKIPKNNVGEFWHWKDLDVGKDICIFGKVFHTVSCDLFTKEWLASQGMELSKEEEIPPDDYTKKERWKMVRPPQKPSYTPDKLRRFLEYGGKSLSFDCYWDNRDAPHGELEAYKLIYFLEDDTIAIKEIHDGSGGKDPFPLLLKKFKLPKDWKARPVSFPSTVLEVTDEEVHEYYAPIDLIIGETIFVLGRRFLLTDCDSFTRKYYRSMLNIEQPPPIKVEKPKRKEVERVFPPHIGIGTPEDTLQSCFGLVPQPPRKDVIKYAINANKNLRYLCELDWMHPEDEGRQFVLTYFLSDGQIKIGEIPRRNSGFVGIKFLKASKLELPDSDPNFPTYYTPDKFFIGAIIHVHKHRFRIIGCDLFVYRYMDANPDKFPPEVINNVRNYHLRMGNLKDELEETLTEEQADHKRQQMAKIGQAAVAVPDPQERCLEALGVKSGEPGPIILPPATTTDKIDYEQSRRLVRESMPICECVPPLKSILRSGGSRDSGQKVVCFTGPAPPGTPAPPPAAPAHPAIAPYPAHQQFNTDEDYCERYRDPGADKRAEMREKNICHQEIIPPREQVAASVKAESNVKNLLPGYLGTYGVDCKKVPEFMKLPEDAYQNVRKLRREVPEVSPAALRVAEHPRLPPMPTATCFEEPPPDLPAASAPCSLPKSEDVAFACAHVEPRLPCCTDEQQKAQKAEVDRRNAVNE